MCECECVTRVNQLEQLIKNPYEHFFTRQLPKGAGAAELIRLWVELHGVVNIATLHTLSSAHTLGYSKHGLFQAAHRLCRAGIINRIGAGTYVPS